MMAAVSQLKWLHRHGPSAGAEQEPMEQAQTPGGRKEEMKDRARDHTVQGIEDVCKGSLEQDKIVWGSARFQERQKIRGDQR